MNKTWQRRFVLASRMVLFASALAFLWVSTDAKVFALQAARDQTALTFDWVGGDPPRFMCVGDSVELLFAMRFVPDANVEALAPLVPSPSLGGALDVQATNGTLSTAHWTLDFGTTDRIAGSFTYTAKTPGIDNLMVTYQYSDSAGSYQGSQPPARIRVQACDYRVKLSLTETRTIVDLEGSLQATTTGEAGFKIQYGEKNARGNTPFFGRGTTEVVYRGLVVIPQEGCSAFTDNPAIGHGDMQVIGEILENGTLQMDVILDEVSMQPQASTNCGDGGTGTATWSHNPNADCLASMEFPPEGGTKTCSEPSHEPLPDGVTATITGDVTVSWEDVK